LKSSYFLLQTYDGSIGQASAGLESHGGNTYCAIADLYLLNRIEEDYLPVGLIYYIYLDQANNIVAS